MVGDCCLLPRLALPHILLLIILWPGVFNQLKKEDKDKDKNSRTQESCPIIMLVDVDPGKCCLCSRCHTPPPAAGAASGQDKKTGGLDQSGGTSRVERTMRAVRPSHCC